MTLQVSKARFAWSVKFGSTELTFASTCSTYSLDFDPKVQMLRIIHSDKTIETVYVPLTNIPYLVFEEEHHGNSPNNQKESEAGHIQTNSSPTETRSGKSKASPGRQSSPPKPKHIRSK